MFRWMGLHFPDWVDCNGVTFSLELIEWGCIYSEFSVKKIFGCRNLKKKNVRFVLGCPTY